MLKNSILYVTRKKFKTIIIFLIILLMTTFSLISIGIREAVDKEAKETYGNITNSFSMEINRRVNPGTPRGGGNIKGKDIEKIKENKDIVGYVKRINSVGDLVDKEIIETKQTLANMSENRKKYFNRTVMITGVNDSKKETKFVSGSYKLVEGKNITNEDKNVAIIHKDLAKKNNLKVGDKIEIKSNIYDADNEKQANEKVELEIIGLFDGHNKSGVTAAQELYENTIITDVAPAAKLYGETEESAKYQDATFFVQGSKDINEVIKQIKKLDIDFNSYSLIKSTSNFPSLQKSINEIYNISKKLYIFSLTFAGIIVTLLLFLWIGSRKNEIGILLSIGKKKIEIFGQFLAEMVLIALPAYVFSFFLAKGLSKYIGNGIVKRATSNISKGISKAAKGSNLGGGAEVDGFNRTITSLNINISSNALIYVIIVMTVILVLAVAISSFNILKKKPKDILTDMM